MAAFVVSFAVPQTAATAATDACRLMSQTDVVQFIGGPAEAAEHPFNEIGSCAYGTKDKTLSASGSIIFTLTTDADVVSIWHPRYASSLQSNCRPSPPPERATICALLAKLATAQTTKDILAVYGTMPNAVKVAGTGEEALWLTSPGGPGAGHQLFARSGDHMVQVLVERKGQEDQAGSTRAAQFLMARFRP
jgi:hypothetical protein